MVANEPTAIAFDEIKLAVSRRRLVVGVTSLVEGQCALCLALSALLRRPPSRRITKPTRRTFDLQDHRVRAAVCQALNNVAFAPSARSRGSTGPIRAKPLHCQFDVHVRRRPIGSYEVFFVLCHLVPDNLNVRRASRARKPVLPKASGSLTRPRRPPRPVLSRKMVYATPYPLARCRFHARLDPWHSHSAAGGVQKARFACL
jgi:hypothetical protein